MFGRKKLTLAPHLRRLPVVANVGVDEVLGAPVVHVRCVLVVARDDDQALSVARESHGHDVPAVSVSPM